MDEGKLDCTLPHIRSTSATRREVMAASMTTETRTTVEHAIDDGHLRLDKWRHAAQRAELTEA
jgi:hypothetical protein